MPSRVRHYRRAGTTVAFAVVLVASACGGGRQAADDPSLVTAALITGPTTTVPTLPTTTVATTVPVAVTVPPATTVAETTAPATDAPTTVALPVPEAPPDEQAQERADELGRVEIPRLGLDLPYFEGVALPTLDKGPGHWPGSAMPGQIGNVVIAGHRVSHSRPFRHIEQLVEGDQVIFTVAGQRYTYVVTGTEIVTPDALRIVDQTPDPTATLFACHPPGSTQFRWVTHLRLQA